MEAAKGADKKHDPKMEQLDGSLKSKIKSFFSAQADPELIQKVQSGEIELKLNLDDIVQKNYRLEQILLTLIKEGGKQEKPHFEQFVISKEACELLRKSKLQNQFGSMCMQGGKFENAGNTFENAMQSFE